MFKFFQFFNNFFFYLKDFQTSILNYFFRSHTYLLVYYKLNEHLWQEGLLIDFLQKKTIDSWLKKFVVYSANLFSERLVFEKIIKVYLNYFIWPTHKFFLNEFNNVSSLLFSTFFFFIFILFFFYFIYIIFLF